MADVRSIRSERTDDELRASSNDLHYEYWMLTSIARAFETGITDNGWLHNALIESFVIHYRVLFEFFYKHPQGDDVSAEHYFASGDDWRRLRPPETPLLRNSIRRSAKEIAHLTYASPDLAPDTKDWDCPAISNDVENVFRAFLAGAPKHRLGKRLLQLELQ
jgi:hypothetical protein